MRSDSKRLTGGQLDLAADRRGELGLEVHLGSTLGEILEHPVAGLERNLGHDASHGLDQVEAGVVEAEVRVVTQEGAREAAELAEDLDAGESAADHGEGEQAVALCSRGKVRRSREIRKNAVAHGGGFLDGLEADRFIRHSRNRERARDGTCGDDDDVVVDHPRLADLRRDGGRLGRVVHRGDLGRDDLGLREVTTVGDHRVTRLDRPGRDLGEEGLVRHVRQRVDEGHLGFARCEPLLQFESGIKTGVSAANDQDFRHAR